MHLRGLNFENRKSRLLDYWCHIVLEGINIQEIVIVRTFPSKYLLTIKIRLFYATTGQLESYKLVKNILPRPVRLDHIIFNLRRNGIIL